MIGGKHYIVICFSILRLAFSAGLPSYEEAKSISSEEKIVDVPMAEPKEDVTEKASVNTDIESKKDDLLSVNPPEPGNDQKKHIEEEPKHKDDVLVDNSELGNSSTDDKKADDEELVKVEVVENPSKSLTIGEEPCAGNKDDNDSRDEEQQDSLYDESLQSVREEPEGKDGELGEKEIITAKEHKDSEKLESTEGNDSSTGSVHDMEVDVHVKDSAVGENKSEELASGVNDQRGRYSSKLEELEGSDLNARFESIKDMNEKLLGLHSKCKGTCGDEDLEKEKLFSLMGTFSADLDKRFKELQDMKEKFESMDPKKSLLSKSKELKRLNAEFENTKGLQTSFEAFASQFGPEMRSVDDNSHSRMREIKAAKNN